MEFGLRLILISFAKFHIVILMWICLFSANILVYVCFHFWATTRSQLGPKSPYLKLWDYSWIVAKILYYVFVMYFVTCVVIENELPSASATTITAELVRMMMKSYAFVRSNVPRVLKYKSHSEDEQVLCPGFTKFLYFYFAPTLVYRDEYPRTKEIKWNYVCRCFLEVIGVIFYVSFIIERYLVSTYHNYGIRKYTWEEIFLAILNNSTGGILTMLCGFYLLLHAWMNGMAEMLRFADRMFYKDWWNASTFADYYPRWNVVVHDWLYTYIYKDIYEVVMPKNKLLAKFAVFFVSAIFHEYIIALMLSFCIPILFILFFGLGLSISFVRIKNDTLGFGNILLWYGLSVGMSILMTTYSIEYYARQNCPPAYPPAIDYFIPRMLYCNK